MVGARERCHRPLVPVEVAAARRSARTRSRGPRSRPHSASGSGWRWARCSRCGDRRRLPRRDGARSALARATRRRPRRRRGARRVQPPGRGRGDPDRARPTPPTGGRRSRPTSAPRRSCSSCSPRTRSARTCGASPRRQPARRGLRVQRGRPAPARAELRITFPAFLCLLGGTLTVDDAVGVRPSRRQR